MNSVIELENVTKIFTNTQGIIRRKKKRVYALHDVNLSIGEKEILGLIGESGSGKTTLGLAVLRLLDLEGGRILFKGKDILSMDKREIFKFREKTEMIFQDPMALSIQFNQYTK